MPKNNDREEFFAHFPKDHSKELNAYVENTVLFSSRYLFYRSAGGLQFVYCTHCKREYMPLYLFGKLKHNEYTRCEKCGSICQAKSSGMGRKKLIDDAYLVWYEKSALNPKSVVAKGFHVVRDYSGDYKKVDTSFHVKAMYLFQPGDPRGKGKERFGKSRMFRQAGSDRFIESNTVGSERRTSMVRPVFFLNEENISAAVQGTTLQYSQWQTFLARREKEEQEWHGFNIYIRPAGEPLTDMIKFFDLATRYPCVEYLVKLGLHKVVETKLTGWEMFGEINWRGDSPEKVLRLTKTEIKGLRENKNEIEPLTLHSYRFHKHHKDGGIQLSFEQAHLIRDLTFDTNKHYMDAISVPYKQIVKYVLKQLGRPGADKRYERASSVLSTWRDYLAECKKLGMDITEEAVLYPNDLHKAHQKTLAKVKYKEDAALNRLMVARLKSLSKYAFELNGLMIRAAKDSAELFMEGKALNHCVGSYAKRYADGHCDILVLRKAEAPDKPFYTMEIRNSQISQCRGPKNCNPTDEVQAFIDAFIKAKLTKKKSKVKITERQEVAV